MRSVSLPLLCLATAIALGAGTTAHATPVTVNFETQAAGAPSAFTGVVNSPLTIAGATFTGGQLLNKESSGVDQTGVYGTVNLANSNYASALTITFASAISDLSLMITNNFAGTYTLTDNFGNSVSQTLGYSTPGMLSLSGSGITSVKISQDQGFWDYAIDNVTYTPASIAATPEPSSLMLLGTGVLGAAGALRRRFLAA